LPISVFLHEGYGLTETSPVIAVNTPPRTNWDCWQTAAECRGADCRRRRGAGARPSIFKGYWKRPEENTRRVYGRLVQNGRHRLLDRDGFLSITDRKKDLIKTSGGKFIAPQPIENSLKVNPFHWDGGGVRRPEKFPAVLIAPHFPALEDWARENDVEFASRETRRERQGAGAV